jgi:O-antigen biosynthesis protein
MGNIRESLKRFAPRPARDVFIAARAKFEAPPWEQIVLHDYELVPDSAAEGRVSLVLPTLSSKAIFGGIATGVDLLFASARTLDVRPRLVVDDFGDPTDFSYIESAANRYAFKFDEVEVVSRSARTQPLSVRSSDLFFSFSSWMALNLRGLLFQQANRFPAARPRPLVSIIQEYEPAFFPMSSTYMMLRAALDGRQRTFGIINSEELHRYLRLQGHAFEREFVIPLRMSKSLKRARRRVDAPKEKTILVYGRPNHRRNCFPAVVAGLKAFVHGYPEYRDWRLESAGSSHKAIDLGAGKLLASLGMLPLDQYAHKLESAGVGLSLMASPHPSYPPLEMAHFGVRTITNLFTCKDLSKAHENILSVEDVLPETIADALARQCAAVVADPEGGWRSRSMLPDYLSDDAYPFLPDFVQAIREDADGPVVSPALQSRAFPHA